MEHSESLNIHILTILITVAICVGVVVKWIRLPYSIALTLAGLAMGVFHVIPPVTMTPELILLVFLPSLLFEASWNLDLQILRSVVRPVLMFATVGVVLSTFVVGAILNSFLGIDYRHALLFGAMVAATDPISVLALFKKMGAEPRLTTILEGESLLNDGTAVVLFRLLLAAAVTGGALDWYNIGTSFLLVTIGGTVLGAVIGWLASQITRYFDDHLLEITLTLIVAYGTYLVAEQLQVSSVIAVLVAGMVVGNYGSRVSMSPTTRIAVNSFWEYAAFIAESLVFLLIGLQIKFDLLVKYAPVIGVAILAILVSRLLVIYGLSMLVPSKKSPVPLAWKHLLYWGGLRGSLCMAMALSLPANFEFREMLIVTTFGIVLFTLFAQGLTIEALVNFLGVKRGSSPMTQFIALQNELAGCEARLLKLDKKLGSGQLSKKDHRAQKTAIEAKQTEIQQKLAELRAQNGEVEKEELLLAQKALFEAQKDCIIRLKQTGAIGPSSLRLLQSRIDGEYLSAEVDQSHSLSNEQA